MKIKVNDKEYNVQVVKEEKELEQGLKGVKELPEDGGMLFVMPDQLTQQVFTMKDMLIPLDIIFINQDREVIDVSENVQPGQPQVVSTTEYMGPGDYVAYVLEVNPGSGVEIGDNVEFEETPMLQIIGPDGEVQGEVGVGARIFSRKKTKQLVKWAKIAGANIEDEEKFNSICKRLGKIMFKELKAQDSRKPEYVKTPE